jgi:L-threonylcarbamoyladenylate synthase
MRTAILYEVSKAVELLKQGDVVAFPTETVYGLGAAIFNPTAIQAIFSVKGRPSDNPLIAHLSDLEQVKAIAIDIPKEFYTLAEAFFPGPLTIVLKRHPNVPDLVSAGLPTIALRMPKHPLAIALIRGVGEPLVAPSANLSGKPSSTSARHVLEDFDGKIAAVIDGGECSIGIESTVLSLLDPEHPVILRPGSITADEIESVLGRPVHIDQGKGSVALAPGMKYRHYAPKAPMHLFTQRDAFEQFLKDHSLPNQLVLKTVAEGNLYANLRKADQEHCSQIVIYCDPSVQKQAGLMNRLTKAASSI